MHRDISLASVRLPQRFPTGHIATGVITVVLATWVTGIFVTQSKVNTNPLAKLERLMDGTAYRPWVFRQLVPKTVALVDHVTPSYYSAVISYALLHHPVPFKWLKTMEVAPAMAYDVAVAVVISFLCLLGYAFLLHRTAALLFPEDPIIPIVAVVLAFVALPPHLFVGYFYDFPVLLFAAAMIYFLGRRQYLWYLVAFGLACLNKETAVLFVLVFVLEARHDERKRFWRYLALNVALGGLILTLQRVIYRNNPGSALESSLGYQMQNMTSLYSWERLGTVFVIFLLVAVRSSEKPLLLKRALWLLVPFFVLFMWGGRPNEFRVFYEVHPPLVLMSAHTITAVCFRSRG